jgi:sugar lactone lactonase YvrE
MVVHPFRVWGGALLIISVVACQGDVRAGESPSAAELAADRPVTELPNPFSTMLRPWGQHPEGLEWGQVSAVDIDRDGRHVWVADRCGASACVGSDRAVVHRLDPQGNVVTRFGASMFIRPHGVHVDRDGNVWVTDHMNARPEQLQEHPDAAGRGQQVFKFSPQGEVLLALGTAGEPGDPPERLNNPTAVIVAPDGTIFVAEGHSNANPPGRISIFSSDGTFIRSFGRFGEGPGEFRTPHGLAFDSQGRLFVADRGNNRIQLFDQQGNFLEELKQYGRPNDVFIDRNDVLYAIDSESGDERNEGYVRGIYVGNARTGELTGWIPPHPSASGPHGTHGEGVALDADGNLYVAEVSIRGMTKYMPR